MKPRRNYPGTKAKDFYKWPDQPFDDMDSALSYQQIIQQNVRSDCFNIRKILEIPSSSDPVKDIGLWRYEHLRQFCVELNYLYVMLQDNCLPNNCSQMTATPEIFYLCAAHKTPKECPALYYTRHTLDGASALLNNSKYFPSRVNIKESSLNKLESISRRLYRIFGHAFYHHREIYDEFENKTALCERFTVFVRQHNLMPADNIIVPVKNFESFVILPSNHQNNPSVPLLSQQNGIYNDDIITNLTAIEQNPNKIYEFNDSYMDMSHEERDLDHVKTTANENAAVKQHSDQLNDTIVIVKGKPTQSNVKSSSTPNPLNRIDVSNLANGLPPKNNLKNTGQNTELSSVIDHLTNSPYQTVDVSSHHNINDTESSLNNMVVSPKSNTNNGDNGIPSINVLLTNDKLSDHDNKHATPISVNIPTSPPPPTNKPSQPSTGGTTKGGSLLVTKTNPLNLVSVHTKIIHNPGGSSNNSNSTQSGPGNRRKTSSGGTAASNVPQHGSPSQNAGTPSPRKAFSNAPNHGPVNSFAGNNNVSSAALPTSQPCNNNTKKVPTTNSSNSPLSNANPSTHSSPTKATKRSSQLNPAP